MDEQYDNQPDEQAAQAAKDILKFCRDIGTNLWEQYNAFVASGFTESQAMNLTIEYMKMNYSLSAMMSYNKSMTDNQDD